jgi:hypothetical protein
VALLSADKVLKRLSAGLVSESRGYGAEPRL